MIERERAERVKGRGGCGVSKSISLAHIAKHGQHCFCSPYSIVVMDVNSHAPTPSLSVVCVCVCVCVVSLFV